jgi:hypothetical protein
MMKNVFNYVLWLSVILLTISCNKDFVTDEPVKMMDNLLSVDSIFDKNVESIALALHSSMDDSKFRTLLKNEINRKADGDYEVILKSLIKRNGDFNTTPLFRTLGVKKVDSKGGYSELVEQYPRLQVSIPVHAEKWDGSSKLWILYLPSGYEEFKTKQVPAISPSGERTIFNVEKEPDFPVIVIGQNERSNSKGDLKYEYNLLKEKVDFNMLALNIKSGEGFTSFTATPVTNAMAVNLSWTFSYPDYLLPYDYYFEIYRDDMTGGGFQKVAEVQSWQTSYYDIQDILPTRTYVYYVFAMVDYYQTYDHAYYEPYFRSNLDEAAMPQIPNFTKNFAVNCIGPYSMELTWTIDNISNWTNLRIERYNAYNPNYQFVADLPITSIHYNDNLTGVYPPYGVKYRYRLTVSNATNNATQEIYCEEMLSNRIDNQSLKLTHIQFSSFSVMRSYEPWYAGAPEVAMSIKKVINNVAVEVIPPTPIGGEQSSGYNIDYSICEWSRLDAKVYTISLIETDPSSDLKEVEVSLGNSVKIPNSLGIEASVNYGLKAKLEMGDDDKFIGTGYLYWWDNADGKDVQCGPYCKATMMSVQN